MSKNNGFIYFKGVEKILSDRGFFGFTAKRNGGRIEYSYLSISNYTVTVKVLTTKLDPNNKIVLGIKVNDKDLNGWNDFIHEINNAHKLHNKLKYGFAKKV